MSEVRDAQPAGAVEVAYDVTTGPPGSPTLLLSNSLGSTRAMWDQQVEPLSRHATVIRYDTRGHGDSPVPSGPYSLDDLADDALALLDRLDVGRVHVVGLSLGGMTGMRLAVRHPERVAGLVALCTSARLGTPDGWHERAAVVRDQGSGAVAEAAVGRWYTEPFRAANPDVVARAEAMVSATPAEGYAGCCEAIAAMDQRADLAAITAPTLAIAGAQDPATPPEHLAAIADGVVDGRLLVVDRAAHLANDEQPEKVTTAIVGHLAAVVGVQPRP